MCSSSYNTGQSPHCDFRPRAVGTVAQRSLGIDLPARIKARLARHVNLPSTHCLLRPSTRQPKSLCNPLIQTHTLKLGCPGYLRRMVKIQCRTIGERHRRVFGFALLSIMADFTDLGKKAGEPAQSECYGRLSGNFSWNCTESLGRNGRFGRFLNRVNNPTTAPQGPSCKSCTTGTRPLELPVCRNVQLSETDMAGGLGRAGPGMDSRRRYCLPQGTGPRGRRRRQGGWKLWGCPA